MYQLLLLLPVQLFLSVSVPVAPEEGIMRAAARLSLGRPESALQLVTEAARPLPAESALAAAAAIVQARALVALGRGEEAATTVAPALESTRPVFRALAQVALGQALMVQGDGAAALVQLRLAAGAEIAHTIEPELSRAGIGAAVAAGGTEEIEWWLKRLEGLQQLPESEQLKLRILGHQAMGRESGRDCRRLLVDYPCADLPQPPCDGGLLLEELSPGERFDRAVRLYECWNYGAAAAEFDHFLGTPRYRRFVDRAHFFLAEIHGRKLRDDRAKAFAHYRHVQEHGGGDREYALYQMARCQMNLEAYDEALAIFRDYLRVHPRGQYSERAWYYLGWLPYDHDRLEEALAGFEEYLSRYARGGELRTYVLWFKAWSLYRLGRWGEALPALERLVGFGNDIVAGKALYWMGRTLVELDRKDEAVTRFKSVVERWPLSYYGLMSHRALSRLGFAQTLPLLEQEAVMPPLALPSQAEQFVSGRLLTDLQPALDAVLVGEVKMARALAASCRGSFDRSTAGGNAAARRWLAELLEEPDALREWGGKHSRARGKVPSSKTQLAWSLEYPLAYRLLVEEEAIATGLPPLFIYSIMRQESRYRRGVISWADAVGLLQVIPPTGSGTAARLGLEFARERLAVPAVNVRLGIGYLGLLAADFNHQLTLVAAAYNAGPQPVRDFVRRNGAQGWDFLVEEIAYNEARNYCRKVTGHVLKYLATYAPIASRQELLPLLFPDEPDFEIGDSVDF